MAATDFPGSGKVLNDTSDEASGEKEKRRLIDLVKVTLGSQWNWLQLSASRNITIE